METADDGGEGSKEKPLKTIGKALELAASGTKRVYVCAEDLSFNEALTASDVTLFGGLACTDASTPWAYVGHTKKTTISAPEEKVPLRVLGSSPRLEVRDIHLIAADSITKPGSSSIAALIESTDVSFVDCILEAGRGADGAPGASFVEAAAPGMDGVAGGTACSAASVSGAPGPMTVCGDSSSVGGAGGKSTVAQGANGSAGQPGDNANSGQGQFTDNGVCSNGFEGSKGANGDPGSEFVGAATIDAKGYTGANGSEGKPGAPGQGGGGGGGAKGGSAAGQCSGTMTGGASGGSGASGGCGGAGGLGGGYGGSSIALLVLGTAPTLTGTQLIAHDGGTAGPGGVGQVGGSGGKKGGAGGIVPAGISLKPGCAGGYGGAGGNGGAGSPGLGGYSLGIAYSGVDIETPKPEQATFMLGKAGDGAESVNLKKF